MKTKNKIKRFLLKGSDKSPGNYDNIWSDKKDIIELFASYDTWYPEGEAGHPTVDVHIHFKHCELYIDVEQLDALIEVLEEFKKDTD